MTYNITGIDETVSISGWIVNINNAAAGLPTIMLIVILWIATFIFSSSKNLNSGEAFTLTNFLLVIVSSLFYFAGMVNLNVIITLIVLFFLGIGTLMFK